MSQVVNICFIVSEAGNYKNVYVIGLWMAISTICDKSLIAELGLNSFKQEEIHHSQSWIEVLCSAACHIAAPQ